MLKQEKSRAAAAEASLQGGTAVAVSSDYHLQVGSVKQQKPTTAELESLKSHDANSTSNQLRENRQPIHRLSHKGMGFLMACIILESTSFIHGLLVHLNFFPLTVHIIPQACM